MASSPVRPRLLGGVAFAVALLATSAGAALPDPTAAGPHAVGYTEASVIRTATLDGAPRLLATTIWYPADVAGETTDPLGHRDAPVARGHHPLLVYSHGGCAYPAVSSFLTTALAGWGFVVVAPSHPGDTIFDGPTSCDVVELRANTLVERVDDVAAVLAAMDRERTDRAARFFRRVARRKVGVLGWSSGGTTALVVGREMPKLRGLLALAPEARSEHLGNGPVFPPTMVMVGEHDYYDPAQASLQFVYDRLVAPRYAVHLRRTGHFAFSDPCVPLDGGNDCGPGTLSQDEAHRLVLRFAIPFLLRHVAGEKRWGTLLRERTETEADADLRR